MSDQKMPDLIKLYIKSCVIGFVVSAVFVGLLLGFDVMGLRGLVFRSEIGVMAIGLIWFFNGIVFAGVQFAFAIMSMADDDDDDDRGGHHQSVYRAEPVPVYAGNRKRR